MGGKKSLKLKRHYALSIKFYINYYILISSMVFQILGLTYILIHLHNILLE